MIEFENDSTKRISFAVNTVTTFIKDSNGNIYQAERVRRDDTGFIKGSLYSFNVNPEERKKYYVDFIVKPSAQTFDELEIDLWADSNPKFKFNLLK
jgi:hypothetical protein